MPPPWPKLREALARHALLVAGGFIATYAMVFTALSVQKFRYYLYQDIDFPIFVQAEWGILHGRLTDTLRGMPWLGDHTSIIMFLVAPLFAVVPSPLTLLAIQSVGLALGGFPMFHLARAKLGSTSLALGCVALYLLQPALGYANLFEFHPETLAVPALLATLYFLEVRRPRPTALAAFMALLCREDVALPMLALAGYALVRFRGAAWREAAWLAGLSFAFLGLSFLVIKPAFHNSAASLGSMYSHWGATPGQVLMSLVRAPWKMIAALFVSPGDPNDTVIKLQYYLHVLLPWAGLPLVSPGLLVVALPVLFEHFLSWREPQHAIAFHYAVLVLPFVSVAGVQALARIVRRRGLGAGRLLMITALTASLASQALFGPLSPAHVPQRALGSERVWPSEDDRLLRPYRDRMVESIPSRGGVVAGFEFLSHVATRDTLHSLHHVYRGTYTFSDRPFPIPTGLAAVVGSFGERAAPERMWEMLRRSRLESAEAVGTTVLFLGPGGRRFPLIGRAEESPSDSMRADFPDGLSFLGGTVSPPIAKAGGLLDLEMHWQLRRPTDKMYVTEIVLFDAHGNPGYGIARHVALGKQNVWEWVGGAPFFDRYRLPLPRTLVPGEYAVMLRVFIRADHLILAKPANGASAEGALVLGTFRLEPAFAR